MALLEDTLVKLEDVRPHRPFAQARLREVWEGGLVVAANLLHVGDGAQRAPETRALTPEPTDSCRRARTETGWQEGGA